MNLKLEVINRENVIAASAEAEDFVMLVYPDTYQSGDCIVFTCDKPGFYELLLEDTLPVSLVYVKEQAVFKIPFGRMPRVGYPPRSFEGVQHLLTARSANPAIVSARRNLALNPLDQRGETGMYPHVAASVETRNEDLFAARNAIDGIHANHSHYPYPFQSWGINQDPDAELTVDFGVPVMLDEIVLTLRADFPHDSYWTQATIVFGNGNKEIVSLEKTDRPQHFSITPRTITSLTLKELVKHMDDSPFPALTQIEAWGTVLT